MSRDTTFRFGAVKALVASKVTIVLQKQMLKKSCSGCSLCAADIPAIELTLPVPINIDLTVGDIVSVEAVELNEAEAALLAFGLPLFWALASYFFMTGIIGWDGDSGQTVGLTLLFGVVGLGSVFVADRVLRLVYPPRLSKVEAMPVDIVKNGESCPS